LKDVIAANRRKKEKLQKKLAKMNKKAMTETSSMKRDPQKKKTGRKTAWAHDAIPEEILVPGTSPALLSSPSSTLLGIDHLIRLRNRFH
jgi:hypothetical protein